MIKNPCEDIELPPANKRKPTFYNEEQIITLFEAIKDEPLYPLIYITVIFGLRRSEVLGLKWNCVDFSGRTITIQHTVVSYSETVRKDKTKTSSNYRVYPMGNELYDLLTKLKKKEEYNRKAFGKEYAENDYIFKWENGVPYRPDFVTSKFSKLLKQYNLPHIRFHDLRHSCASLLLAKEFTLADIKEWLGHSDISVTANFYAHLDINRKKTITDMISESFSELC